MIFVSACLAGINCKYNGGNNYDERILKLVKEGKAIPVCPEQLGGLPTPRIPSEVKKIDGKRYVFNTNGEDVTHNFVRGAEEVLALAKQLNIKKAVLKSRSPSCGKGKIYNGNFNKELTDDNGITAQILMDNGIDVISSDEIDWNNL